VSVIHDSTLHIINPIARRIQKLPVAAQSVALHPEKNIVFISAGGVSQMFDLDMKMKLNNMETSPVLYSKWIDENTVAYVTIDGVFHLDVKTWNSKLIYHIEDLVNTEVLDYTWAKTKNWHTVVLKKDNYNAMVLHSGELNVKQVVQCTDAKVVELADGSIVTFAVIAREKDLMTIMVHPERTKNVVSFSTQPEAICVNNILGFVLVTFPTGELSLYDIATGLLIDQSKANNSIVRSFPTDNGFILLDRVGNFYNYQLKKDGLVKKAKDLSTELWKRVSLLTFKNSTSLKDVLKPLTTLKKTERDRVGEFTAFAPVMSLAYPDFWTNVIMNNHDLCTSEEIKEVNNLLSYLLYGESYDIFMENALAIGFVLDRCSEFSKVKSFILEYVTSNIFDNNLLTTLEQVEECMARNGYNDCGLIKSIWNCCLLKLVEMKSQVLSRYKNEEERVNRYLSLAEKVTPNPEETNPLPEIVVGIKGLYNDITTNDITILAFGKQYFLHKTVLSSQSPVFEVMMDENSQFNDVKNGTISLSESDEPNTSEEVNLKSSSIEAIFKFCYGFNLDEDIPYDISLLICIYDTANLYQIEGLKRNIGNKLESMLSMENFLDVAKWVSLYDGASELYTSLTSYAVNHTKDFFTTFSNEDLQSHGLLMTLIARKLAENKQ